MSEPEADEQPQERAVADDTLTTALADVELVVRSMEKREIEARIVPYNEIVNTRDIGPEMFLPGSFAHIDPKKVVLQLEHEGPAAGRGVSLDERSDGPYMTFRASRTPRGDEILELAHDGVTRSVSVTYDPSRSEFEIRNVGGRRVTAVKKADLRAVSTTWKPVYERASITAVRSQVDERNTPMAEAEVQTAPVETPPPAPVVTNVIDNTPVVEAITALSEQMRSQSDGYAERIASLEERIRSEFTIPGGKPAAEVKAKSDLFLETRAGSPALFRMRANAGASDLADVTVADQDATLPAYVGDMSDVLTADRPFLATTREIPAGDQGTAIQLPKITQHTQVGVQSAEKTEVATRAFKTDLDTFNMITVAGAVDVSLQFLKRAPASIRNLLFDDMAAEYAATADSEALDALLDEASVNEGGAIDPEALSLGASFINSFGTALRRAPNTIWLSTAALGAFIDAKSENNTPLYGSVTATATAAGGISGTISGLRAVHVPALADKSVDAIVGPSSGFIWAEDGTYRLEVDNPELAGRDIGIVGFLFLMPRYPAAFTTYTLGS